MVVAERMRLDVREIEAELRPSRVFQAFESLPEGGEMVLVVECDPGPLLSRFQAERAGCYDWSVLEEGPEVWCILVTRHPASDPKARSAAAYLGWDHDRLEELLTAHHEALIAGRLVEAVLRFAEFSSGLRHHIRMEEAVLFPAYDRAVGDDGRGPTAVMRQEHRIIEGLLDRIAASLADPEMATSQVELLRSALVHVLGEHNAKEEHIVYPLTDLHHPSAERAEMIRRMQAV